MQLLELEVAAEAIEASRMMGKSSAGLNIQVSFITKQLYDVQ